MIHFFAIPGLVLFVISGILALRKKILNKEGLNYNLLDKYIPIF